MPTSHYVPEGYRAGVTGSYSTVVYHVVPEGADHTALCDREVRTLIRDESYLLTSGLTMCAQCRTRLETREASEHADHAADVALVVQPCLYQDNGCVPGSEDHQACDQAARKVAPEVAQAQLDQAEEEARQARQEPSPEQLDVARQFISRVDPEGFVSGVAVTVLDAIASSHHCAGLSCLVCSEISVWRAYQAAARELRSMAR